MDMVERSEIRLFNDDQQTLRYNDATQYAVATDATDALLSTAAIAAPLRQRQRNLRAPTR